MTGFMVDLMNRPEELARLIVALAAEGIGLRGFSGTAGGSVYLVTDDPEGTRRILVGGHYLPLEVELVSVTLADRPGSLAETARRFGDAGINIEAVLPTRRSGGTIRVAFATDDPVKARAVLGDVVLAGATA